MSFDFVYSEIFPCSSTFWPWMTGVLANTTLLLIVVFGAGALVGQRRAPLRNLIGSLGLGSLALLPILSLLVAWQRGLSGGIQESWAAPGTWMSSTRPEDLGRMLLAVWAIGAALLLLRLLIDLGLLGWHARHGTESAGSRWDRAAQKLAGRLGMRRSVRVLYTDAFDIPFTWGVLRPVILLPRSAADWREERRNVVLLHELGHVRRWDGPLTAFCQFACALYWFHPLAWWIGRRAQEDAERACDSLVLENGMTPERYARHLLGIIRDSRRGIPSIAPTMATESHVARRIAALLDPRRGASRIGKISVIAAGAFIVAITLLLTSLSVPGASEDGLPLAGIDCSEPAPVLESLPDDYPESTPY